MNQNFSVLAMKQACLNVPRLFHGTSNNFGNHYDTLKVQRNCTSQQIRDSFIKLSKKNHPDLNNSPNAHKNFLKIQEAYNVLSKPHLRANYDLGLSQPGFRYENNSQRPYGPRYTAYRHSWDEHYFYQNNPQQGMPRRANGVVALFVMAAAGLVLTVEIVLIRYTLFKQQKIGLERSMEAQRILDEVEEKAKVNGRQLQLKIYQQQYEEMERFRAAGK